MSGGATVDALVTGKIRDAQIFVQVMGLMLRLRESGTIRNILFSGWADDFVAHRAIIDQLRAAGVALIDNGGGLPVRSVGNYWEQVKTLQGGLERIEDGVFVFKTRTDMLFYGGDETVTAIVRGNIGYPCTDYGLRHRIWIPSFVALQPFFMADQCYLGLAEDLKRFLRYDADVEAQGIAVPLYPGSATHPAAASAEIRFWLQPFLEQFPLLQSYRKVWPHSMNGYPHYPALQEYNLASPLYREFLAVYWMILYLCFRVSEGRFAIVNGIDAEGRMLVRAQAHSNNSLQFIADAVHLKGHYPVSYSTDAGLRAMLESADDPYRREVFYPAFERARGATQSAERLQATAEYLDHLAAMARAQPQPAGATA